MKVCDTVKGSVAEYIGVAADLSVEGNYNAIRKAVSQAVANDATLQHVPLADFPVVHLHSLELALLDVAGALPSTQRATTATALLEEIRGTKKLLANRRYDKKYREKVKKRKAEELAREEEQRQRDVQEEQVRETARQERDASEKLELRRMLDEAVEAKLKADGELLRMREACEQQGREQEAAAQRAVKEAEETREILEQERESAKRDLAALREHFRSVEAEKTEGKLRRAPKRTCNDIEEVQPKPPLTPLDFRDQVIFPDLKVAERKSSIHGMGSFSKHGAMKKDVLMDVVLPSEKIGKGFKYDCYKHIMHRDGSGAMHIDPASRMRGTFGACREDFALKFIRLLNHSENPNVEFDADEAARPEWYEVVGKEYKLWYRCTFYAKRKIKKGEELTFKYAIPPKGAV